MITLDPMRLLTQACADINGMFVRRALTRTPRPQLTRGPAWLRGHRGTHPTPPDPCTCRYILGRIPSVALPYHSQGAWCWHFTINPGCPHHGHHRHAYVMARLREVEYWDEHETTARRTLDDEELCDGYGE